MTIRPKKTEANTAGLTSRKDNRSADNHKRIEQKIRQHKARQDLGRQKTTQED